MAEREKSHEEEGGGEEHSKPCPKLALGAPLWYITYADMITLLLCFFILLLTFSSQDKKKAEAALGSMKNALGGGPGMVSILGRSFDNAFTILEGDSPPKPFPIEFAGGEGLLDKMEINRPAGDLSHHMLKDLKEHELSDTAEVYEIDETAEIRVTDRISFKQGSDEIERIHFPTFEKIIEMMKDENYHLVISGYAAKAEKSLDGKLSAAQLSSKRAIDIANLLISRGVPAERTTIVSYGDSRSQGHADLDRKVEFTFRKSSLHDAGRKVNPDN